ncbi:unnamed protein product [Diamesa serratosioi]
MKQLQLILIFICSYICVLSISNALPITSQPLENNADHLAWDAWLMGDSDSQSGVGTQNGDANRSGSPYGGKSKKITPKSIFITPNFNNISSSHCPMGYKIDDRGQCIRIVNINQDDLLVTRLQSLLSQTTDNTENGIKEDYYDDYTDDIEESTGPIHFNLPLTFDNDPAPYKSDEKLDNNDDYTQLEPFLGKPPIEQSNSFVNEKITSTTEETKFNYDENDSGSSQNLYNILSTTSHAIHNFSVVVKDDLTLNNTTNNHNNNNNNTEINYDIDDDTDFYGIKNISNSTTSNSDSSTIKTIDSLFMVEATSSQSTTSTTTATLPADVNEDKRDENNNNETIINQFTDDINLLVVANSTTTNTTNNITSNYDEDLKINDELMNESFIIDGIGNYTNNNATTITAVDDYTELMITQITTEDESEIMRDYETTQQMPTDFTVATTLIDDLVTTNTQIEETTNDEITIKNDEEDLMVSGDDSFDDFTTMQPIFVEDVAEKSKSNQVITSTTPAIHIVTSETSSVEIHSQLHIENDTELNVKNRETLFKQEQNDSDMEDIDSSNRFVYHHLPSVSSPSSFVAQSSTFSPIPTSLLPPRVNSPSANDQIGIVHRIVGEEQQKMQQSNEVSKVRFPSQDEERTGVNPVRNVRPDVVKFPGASTNRLISFQSSTPTNNRLSTTVRKPVLATTTKPPFWWLPKGWEVDQNSRKPALIKFWSSQPLIQDPASNNWRDRNSNNPSPPLYYRPNHHQNPNRHHQYQQQNQHQQQQHQHQHLNHRENSKSPSENLYREISGQDVYRVLGQRNWKHNNNR